MRIYGLKALVWILERLLECSIAAGVLYIWEAVPSHFVNDPFLEQVLRLSLLPIAFYFMSGYLISCIVFGYVRRAPWPLIQGAKLSALFILHVVFFSAIWGSGFLNELGPLLFLSAVGVFIANFFGSRILARLVSPH